MKRWQCRWGILLVFVLVWPAAARSAEWKAGAAKVVITPSQSMWMSGYAARKSPAEGKLTDLWAKALVVEDARGERLVFVTLDLIGLDRELSLEIRRQLEQRYGLERRQIALLCSHTHTGPVVGRNLASMYFLDDQQWKLIEEYAARVRREIVHVVGEAIRRLGPAELVRATGTAAFAVNRRNNRAADVPRLRAEGKLKGPVDHDVPVLAVRKDGKWSAVVFGYACHATTLSSLEWSGDYPGFAQIELEKAHPGTIALFWAGCGADQNPLPRRKVELAKKYGRALAEAVDKVLDGPMHPVTGCVASAYEEIDLAFDKLPTREQLEEDTQSTNRYVASRARLLLERIEREGRLPSHYPYPIQTWRVGSEVVFVILGGEVVVDYALRLKRELGADTTWVAGYANDVMAYIPSLRVLREGGYEGVGAMVYYGLPCAWAPTVEEHIMRTVHAQVERLRAQPCPTSKSQRPKRDHG